MSDDNGGVKKDDGSVEKDDRGVCDDNEGFVGVKSVVSDNKVKLYTLNGINDTVFTLKS